MLKRALMPLCLAAAVSAASGQAIVWSPSLAAAKQEAKNSGRPALIHESFDECSACRHYRQVVYPDPAVQALAGRFVWARLGPLRPGAEPPKLPGADMVTHPLLRFVRPDWKDAIYYFTQPLVKPQAFVAIMERVLGVVEAEAAAAGDAEDVEAWYALGVAHFGFEPPNYDKALKPFQQVVRLDPQDRTGHLEEARLDLAIATLYTGGEKKAVGMLRAFVQAYPESKRLPEALYYQAAGMVATGDVAGAQKVLATIEDTEPQGSQWADWAEEMATRLQIATWREQLPLPGEAPDLREPAYTEEQIELLFQIGHACIKVRQYDWALRYIRQYLRYDPGNLLGHRDDAELDRAIALVSWAPQVAILNLERYAREHAMTPRMHEVLLAMGVAYLSLGQLDPAQRHLLDVTNRYPATRSARTARTVLEEMRAGGARRPGGPGGVPDWLRGAPVLPP